MKDKKKLFKVAGYVGTILAVIGGILSVGSDMADVVEKKEDLDNYKKKQLLIESRSSEEED